LKITHVIPYLGRAMGGPVEALAGYAAVLAEQGCAVSVVAAPRPADGPPVTLPHNVTTVLFPQSHGGMFRWCPALARHLAQTPADIIHSHGLWTYASYAAGRAAQHQGVPHVLAPCGMLHAGALRRSGWKKGVCRILFQDRVLREAACLHAKSGSEYDSLRQFGLRNPVALIPNPVRRPADLLNIDPAAFRIKHGLDGRRVALYVGRIHPVKGLRRLITAWIEIAGRHGDWQLVVAGPDEANMMPELKDLLARASTADARRSVSFVGHLQEEEIWQAYRAAELFVMPSDYENFGTAIVEALQSGLPVITTTGTPWKALPAQGAGWCVAPTADALETALQEALEMPEEIRRQMGQRAAVFAAPFSPAQVGRDLMSIYAWLLGAGTQPACIRID
jgi:glycosyltransferase involved in cell wall biosynthesis